MAKRDSMPDRVSVAVNQPYIPNDESKAIVNGIADEFRDNQFRKSVMPQSKDCVSQCRVAMPKSSASTGIGFT